MGWYIHVHLLLCDDIVIDQRLGRLPVAAAVAKCLHQLLPVPSLFYFHVRIY